MGEWNAQSRVVFAVIIHAIQVAPMHGIGVEVGYCGLFNARNGNISSSDGSEKVLGGRDKVRRVMSSFESEARSRRGWGLSIVVGAWFWSSLGGEGISSMAQGGCGCLDRTHRVSKLCALNKRGHECSGMLLRREFAGAREPFIRGKATNGRPNRHFVEARIQ